MKTVNDQSQDSKKEKPATRLVKMKLPLDLIDAIEIMAEDAERNFHNMVTASLHWAAWAHSHGRGPDTEMFEGEGGYRKWDERLRAKREVRALNQLYGATGLPGEENAVSHPHVAARSAQGGG